MSAWSPPEAGSQCAETLGIDYTPIENCAEGTQGDELLAALGDRTHNFTPQITFVPTVAINDVYSQKDQDDAMSDLTSVICRYITGTKPDACND
ncbi:GILT-like protein C02D5.2 [Zootermopsis nevadensis]|uniref:GILT-like protein C02D5.2 n=2 Tax=Zootermopsis nevadensis TaxID=136037 RepID=A0A067RBM5_ZOONE|nr:GILT-like protein C02D5.2 [Zootermopsis nevadensis]